MSHTIINELTNIADDSATSNDYIRTFNDDTIISTNLVNDFSVEPPPDNQLINTNTPKKLVNLRFISTNARSVAPKMDSLVQCFIELDLHFAVVTESCLGTTKD